jgi:hypothetical protein
MRHDFQQIMTGRFTDAIEELTGCRVTAFLPQAHVDPDVTIEIFLIDRRLDGSGEVESVASDSRRRLLRDTLVASS